MVFESFRNRALLAALIVVGGSTAQAQVANGGFEAAGGSLNSWGSVGNAFASTGAIFPTPAEGTHQATLATFTDGSFGEPAGIGVNSDSAESFLGIASGSLMGVGNGHTGNISAISQSVHLNIGDKLVFKFDFLTNQTNNDPSAPAFAQRPSLDSNDFAFLSVAPASGSSTVSKLIDTFYGFHDVDPSSPSGFQTGFSTTPTTDPFISESGYLNGTYTATSTDDFTFGFGVANAFTVTNSGVNSGLVVDNVHVVAAVPEPATMVGLSLGFFALLRRGTRKSR